jgi:hypothetical protein
MVLLPVVAVALVVVSQINAQVRWFSFDWFKHEALADFDFVWRMDVDLWLKFPVIFTLLTITKNDNCFIPHFRTTCVHAIVFSQVPCDIFSVMATSRAAFGL